MSDACEELRVNAGDGGRLFRKAMMKTGLWKNESVPIEYARGLTEYVGTPVKNVEGAPQVSAAVKVKVWDGDWKRH